MYFWDKIYLKKCNTTMNLKHMTKILLKNTLKTKILWLFSFIILKYITGYKILYKQTISEILPILIT